MSEALTRAFEEKLDAFGKAMESYGIVRGIQYKSYLKRMKDTREAVLALYREALADREAMRDALDEARQKAADMEAAWHCAEDELDRNFAARAHQEDRE